ncbi:hypothetical protein SCOR_27515 [Sulfidibacter corallicola]|uniref:Uncharacterized protein n=1 Tax=Sulfidibacter corallicola TaxID=2818388 RepID=A0A8A4TNA9_SULCO|nr:hypothetical protein [Sulfidibacter corallicola]QTD50694.1 hypothetical protein J3U87_34340 [Sulfidibacter corallicola]
MKQLTSNSTEDFLRNLEGLSPSNPDRPSKATGFPIQDDVYIEDVVDAVVSGALSTSEGLARVESQHRRIIANQQEPDVIRWQGERSRLANQKTLTEDKIRHVQSLINQNPETIDRVVERATYNWDALSRAQFLFNVLVFCVLQAYGITNVSLFLRANNLAYMDDNLTAIFGSLVYGLAMVLSSFAIKALHGHLKTTKAKSQLLAALFGGFFLLFIPFVFCFVWANMADTSASGLFDDPGSGMFLPRLTLSLQILWEWLLSGILWLSMDSLWHSRGRHHQTVIHVRNPHRAGLERERDGLEEEHIAIEAKLTQIDRYLSTQARSADTFVSQAVADFCRRLTQAANAQKNNLLKDLNKE